MDELSAAETLGVELRGPISRASLTDSSTRLRPCDACQAPLVVVGDDLDDIYTYNTAWFDGHNWITPHLDNCTEIR